MDSELLVGVALSGGGSRAALVAAAGLEALGHVRTSGGGWPRGHLGEVLVERVLGDISFRGADTTRGPGR